MFAPVTNNHTGDNMSDQPSTTATDSKLLTEEQAAKIIGVSPFSLARERKRGRIAFCRPGGHVIRYRHDDVQAYIARSRRPAIDEAKAS